MANKITGILIHVGFEKATVETIDNTLEGLYSLLECDLVEIPTRKIGAPKGRYYTVVCDEEGLFAEHPKISAIDNLGQPMLVGNLFICNSDYENGELTSLTDDDIKYLSCFIKPQATNRYRKPYPMLHQCEY